MFGVANQLLAAVALTVATSALINAGKVKYIWTTMIPLVFVATTTLYAGWLNIFTNFLPLARQPGKEFLGGINVALTAVIMVCVVVVLIESSRRAYKVLALGKYSSAGMETSITDIGFAPPEYGEA
jgi:carbon starvation protein